MAASIERAANLPASSQTAGDKVPQHVLITNSAGTLIETFGGTGGTATADGSTHTANTTQGTPAQGVYESTPTTLTTGKLGTIGLTANREVKVSVTSGGTAGTQYTEGDVDTTITGTALMWEDASDTLVSASAAKPLPVSLASVPSHAVTNAGTFVTQENGAALTSLQLLDDVVLTEDAAHVSGDKGVMALSVRSDTAAAKAGTDGDYQPLVTDASGRLHVNVGNTVTISGTVTANAGTGTLATAEVGTGTLATNQVSISTTATQIVASRAGRRFVTVFQLGTTQVSLGNSSGVTTSTGIPLIGTVGSAVTFEYSGAVYGIVGSGTNTVAYAEEY